MVRINRVPTRLIGAAAVGAMIVGSAVGAHATVRHKPKPIIRKVTYSYQGGCGLALVAVSATPGACAVGDSYVLSLHRGEKYISVAVKDGLSAKVPGVLWLGSGVGAANQPFCTSIKNFAASGTRPQLDLFDGADPRCSPGSATSGKILVTYSSIPIR